MLRLVEWPAVADVSKKAVPWSLGSSLYLWGLDPEGTRIRWNGVGTTRPNTISYLWRQIFSNSAMIPSHIRYLGLGNRQLPELGTNSEKYGSNFTQPLLFRRWLARISTCLPTAVIAFCDFLCHFRRQLPYHSTLYGMSYWKKKSN